MLGDIDFQPENQRSHVLKKKQSQNGRQVSKQHTAGIGSSLDNQGSIDDLQAFIIHAQITKFFGNEGVI